MDATQKAPHLLNAISIMEYVHVRKILLVNIVTNAAMIIQLVPFQTVPVSMQGHLILCSSFWCMIIKLQLADVTLKALNLFNAIVLDSAHVKTM